jgi:hypothetical protein
MENLELIGQLFHALKGVLDERQRRLFAAAAARAIGEGGQSAVARATGVSRRTIRAGLRDSPAEPGKKDAIARRVRRPGGGRKKTVEKDPTLLNDLEQLVDPTTRGDPMSPLRWTCKSMRQLADELRRQGHPLSHVLVAELLHGLNYSLQGNRKTLEGGEHADRDAQFRYIHARVLEFQASGDPVISVDTKKKELVGPFKNGGREWRPQGQPEKVRVHDFKIDELGRVSPYGVYDLAHNEGWVSVGCDHDTAMFAVETVRRWWKQMGASRYPQARRLLITADGGGSNGARVRLWKVELQRLAHELGFPISVCHFPPGTSKWNKIEHRMFAWITMNWRGRPLVSHEVIVNLIQATTTAKGLRVECAIDDRPYPAGIKVPDEQVAALSIERDEFHGEWNYTLLPRPVPETVIS